MKRFVSLSKLTAAARSKIDRHPDLIVRKKIDIRISFHGRSSELKKKCNDRPLQCQEQRDAGNGLMAE